MTVKATLLDIQLHYASAANEGREPTPEELGRIMERHFPALDSARRCYWRGMGQFIGSALEGFVYDPNRWDPPD